MLARDRVAVEVNDGSGLFCAHLCAASSIAAAAPNPMFRFFNTLVFSAFLGCVARAAEPAPIDPWQAGLAFDYDTAEDRLAAMHRAAPADGRIAVAYASALLVKQPRTEANIREAADLLRTAAATTDETSVLASYLLARVEIDHLSPPEPDAARARLEKLRIEHPGHVLADQAAVQLAYLAAFPDGRADVAAIPAIDALLASVRDPGASRDIHHLLANLHLRVRKSPADALPHLVAARAIGHEQPLRDADIDLSIANIARETGDAALARRHYAAFLSSAPSDARADTVRRLLADLPAAQ